VNRAYKHLDTRIRVGGLTFGQWASVGLGVALGIVWGKYVSPLPRQLTFITAFYLAGLPVTAVIIANHSEFDLWLYLRSWWRWRKAEDRYAAGPGEQCEGYAVEAATEVRELPTPIEQPAIDALGDLWS